MLFTLIRVAALRDRSKRQGIQSVSHAVLSTRLAGYAVTNVVLLAMNNFTLSVDTLFVTARSLLMCCIVTLGLSFLAGLRTRNPKA